MGLEMSTKGKRIVADARDEMRKHFLRWFGYVMRLDEENLVRAVLDLRVAGAELVPN